MNSHCDDCINAQATLGSIAYIRVQDSDVMIVACRKHLEATRKTLQIKYETLDEIREYSKKEKDAL